MALGIEITTSRVFLVGLMGAGKSTVGTALAQLLGWPYLDNDVLLARQTGADAQQLARSGGLHQHESMQLRAVLHMRAPFVAGVAASVSDRPEDFRAIMATGVVVYLRAQPETLAERVGRGEGRPWLDDPLPALRQMFANRDPHFRGAHHVFDTDTSEPEPVARAIAELLRSQ